MPYKLLLADDSVTIQRVIELTFADEDVKVKAVGDGQHAIDQIASEPPDIVLADVGMPKRDGYEVAAFIKNDPALEHIPVLLLTGAFEPVDEERARAVRCDGVLAKPFEPQLLISRVKELLSQVTPSSAGPSRSHVEPTPVVVGPPVAVVPEPVQPEFDEDATVRMARPPAFKPEDLRLDAGTPSVQPEPQVQADGSLDDYFDRLDAAFAHLTGGQPGKDAPTVRPQPANPWEAAVRTTSEWPPVEALPHADEVHPALEPDLEPQRVEVAGAGPEFGATSSPSDDLDAVASAVSLPVSDAFAALLDAERTHGADVVHRGDDRSAVTVVLPGTAVTQTFLDDVSRRVMERLGDPAFRDVVSAIVSSTAERLIREEIERVKAGIR